MSLSLTMFFSCLNMRPFQMFCIAFQKAKICFTEKEEASETMIHQRFQQLKTRRNVIDFLLPVQNPPQWLQTSNSATLKYVDSQLPEFPIKYSHNFFKKQIKHNARTKLNISLISLIELLPLMVLGHSAIINCNAANIFQYLK